MLGSQTTLSLAIAPTANCRSLSRAAFSFRFSSFVKLSCHELWSATEESERPSSSGSVNHPPASRRSTVAVADANSQPPPRQQPNVMRTARPTAEEMNAFRMQQQLQSQQSQQSHYLPQGTYPTIYSQSIAYAPYHPFGASFQPSLNQSSLTKQPSKSNHSSQPRTQRGEKESTSTKKSHGKEITSTQLEEDERALLEDKLPPFNLRCSYGDECVACNEPDKYNSTLNEVLCAFCKRNQLHHVCQIFGQHVQVLADMGVEADALKYTCRDCLPQAHPELQQQNQNDGAADLGADGVDIRGRDTNRGAATEQDSNQFNNGCGTQKHWYLLENLYQVDVMVDDPKLESALLFLEDEGYSAINTFKKYVEEDGNKKNFHPLAILSVMGLGGEVSQRHLEKIEEYKRWSCVVMNF
jgi:hypothetical protein